jgi:hypothetical protein
MLGAVATKKKHMPIPELTSTLADMIGPKFVAYATSETNPSVIEGWINGSSLPSAESQERLRLTYKISKIVHDKFGTRDMVQAWLQGKNPDLNDNSAVILIRNSENPAALEAELTAAAELFAAK